MYFSSNRPNGVGGFDIYVAARAAATSAFVAPQNVASVNSDVMDFPIWISPDGCVLYFTRQLAATNYDLFVASRAP